MKKLEDLEGFGAGSSAEVEDGLVTAVDIEEERRDHGDSFLRSVGWVGDFRAKRFGSEMCLVGCKPDGKCSQSRWRF